MCEQRRTDLLGADGEEDDGFFLGVGLVGEEGNIAIGVLAVDDFGARRAGDPQAFQACRDAPIGADGDGGADTPDVSPPRAAGCRAQDGLLFLSGTASGGIRGAADFPVDFLGIAMVPEGGEQGIGGERRGDGFGGEEGWQPALPVLVLPFNFALGLRGAGEPEGDAIKVKGRAELGQGVRAVGEKHAVAVDVKFERQAVFDKGGGEEVEVGQEIFRVIDRGPGADPGAVIQQIQQWIMAFVPGEPPVRGGVQLPQRADFEALPAARGGGWTGLGQRVRQAMCQRPAPDSGRIQGQVQAAEHF